MALASTGGEPLGHERCRLISKRFQPENAPKSCELDDLPEEAPDHMLQEPNGLLLDQLSDHIAENGSNRIEPFISMTNVSESSVVEENLLHNKYGHCLAQL